tara:strand:+ start:1371 stop:2816 length:1446 start_codon:yes stop_codon:yes gene_type:complete
MKTLVIESAWISPHLETAGEILINLKKQNKKVKFAWVGNDLKWNDYSIPSFLYALGCSPEKRVDKFIKILKKNNIEIVNYNDQLNKILIEKWSNSFNGNLNDLKAFKYKKSNLGMGIASSLISLTNNKNFNTNSYKKKITGFLYSSAMVYERTIKILDHEKPNVVITFNNRLGLSLPIIQACKKKNVKIIRHDRGSNFKKFHLYDYDINDPRNLKNIYSDWKKNKNKNKNKIAKNFFKKKFNSTFLDEMNKNFTKNQIKNSKPITPKGKKIITFFCSTEYEIEAYLNLKFNQMKAFKKFFSEVKKIKNFHLIIRVHPSLSGREDHIWKKFQSKNVTLVKATSSYDSYEIMKKSDIVCAYTSKIVIESAYLGIPTICLKDFGWPKGLGILYGENKTKISFNLKKCLNKKIKFNLDKIFSVSYFYSTYGINYKYYNPISIRKGKFLNESLEWKSRIVIFFEYLGLKRLYAFLKKLNFHSYEIK